MKMNFRKTKIVCTIGPATRTPEGIAELIHAGMNVARLNFSHGDHEEHRETIRTLRRISKEVGREMGILQDLRGPKIRLGKLPVEEVPLHGGDRVVLKTGETSETSVIPVSYPYIFEDVAVGDRILLADGLVELRVEGKEEGNVHCSVVVGGVIQSHKGMNLPSSSLRVAAFTEKDRKDLALGLEEGVDFVALSFVRHEKDLEPVRRVLNESIEPPLLIAKIEKPQAIERLESILPVVDGVMVARGDMGVEMPLEEVPIIQKRIIRLARNAGKPVITATQMLRSMIDNPRPTRAEATDVANAIFDGTDALMLSEETAIGAYPAAAVRVLDRIAGTTEKHLDGQRFLHEALSDILPLTESAISRAACFLAEDLDALAIVAATSSGSTARLVSRFRPACPVIGLTPDVGTQRKLSLTWGVLPALITSFKNTEEIFLLARSWVLSQGLVERGDRLIVTAGVPVGTPGTTNLLRVIEVA